MMPRVAIVLTDSFPILSLTLVTEPLRVANREDMDKPWQWHLLSVQGGLISSSSGFDVQTERLNETAYDVVLLLSAYMPETGLVKPLLSWLRKKNRAGVMMGCVDTGALIFAAAGLLRHKPAAVHFEALKGYREKYTDQLFVDRMFDVSECICSSAGGVATFDMTLGLIERYSGREAALRVAEILTYRPTGFDGPQQKLLTETALMRLDRNLGRAVDLMTAHLDEPLPIQTIAARLDIPEWTLARLCQRYFKQTPSAYYRGLRLSQARNLVLNSNYRIGEIGRLCGFENPESFARAYRREFGKTASFDRKVQRVRTAS